MPQYSEVHLWQASLDVPVALRNDLEQFLTPEERARAVRFRFPEHQHRFVSSRGMLRVLLATYLSVEPDAVGISYTRYGKPFLDMGSASPSLTFNLSHSGDTILYAFSCARIVGVDLETIRHDIEIAQLARLCFSPREQEELVKLPPEQQLIAFFRCWTCKEAYLKALGVGLSVPPSEFTISLHPHEPVRLVEPAPAEGLNIQWSLRQLDLGPDMVGALAVAGNEEWNLICQSWHPTDWATAARQGSR